MPAFLRVALHGGGDDGDSEIGDGGGWGGDGYVRTPLPWVLCTPFIFARARSASRIIFDLAAEGVFFFIFFSFFSFFLSCFSFFVAVFLLWSLSRKT